MSKTLVAYYSQTGQSKKMAKMLRQKLGADIYEIETHREYNDDMWKAADEAAAELKSGNLPQISSALPDLSSYDTVIVGGPVWGQTISNPVLSFMRQMDFSGKKVSSFWTFYDHDENYNKSMQEEAIGARVIDGLSLPRAVTGNTNRLQKAIDQWIKTVSV